jgi:seryl-tRNA synthetase
MLELSLLRENTELVIERLAIKRVDARETIKKILEADLNRRETQKLLDDNLAESNQIAREVGILFKAGRQEEANELKARSADLKTAARDLTEKLDALQKEQMIYWSPCLTFRTLKRHKVIFRSTM